MGIGTWETSSTFITCQPLLLNQVAFARHVATDKEDHDPLVVETMEANKRVKTFNLEDNLETRSEAGWETDCDSVGAERLGGLQLV
jgi:hypothetical protein